MPAVRASLSFGALAIRSAVRYAGQKGWEMTTSASGSSRSKTESSPLLVRGHDQRVASRLEIWAESEFTRYRAE